MPYTKRRDELKEALEKLHALEPMMEPARAALKADATEQELSGMFVPWMEFAPKALCVADAFVGALEEKFAEQLTKVMNDSEILDLIFLLLENWLTYAWDMASLTWDENKIVACTPWDITKHAKIGPLMNSCWEDALSPVLALNPYVGNLLDIEIAEWEATLNMVNMYLCAAQVLSVCVLQHKHSKIATDNADLQRRAKVIKKWIQAKRSLG